MIVSSTWLLIALVLAVDGNSVPSDEKSQGKSLFGHLQGNVMDQCANRLNSLRFDTTEAASQALDAFGKPEAGLLVNNREWLGHFSECTNLKDFKYCLLNINVTAEIALTPYKKIDLITWGVCLPRQCSYEDLHYNLQILVDLSTYTLQGFYVNKIYEDMWCLEDPVAPYGLGFYITVIFFFVLGILMIAGTILDKIESMYLANDQENDHSMEIAPLLADQTDVSVVGSVESSAYDCMCFFRRTASITRLVLLDFALNRNLKKLLNVGECSDLKIGCLDGIRVISMFWIILGHVILIPFEQGVSPVNHFEFAEWKDNFFFQTLILNFFYAVDSFFLLSGLLVCFTTLHKLEADTGRYQWGWFYLHRYIRLSPLMVVTIMIFMYISPHFIRGPNAHVYANTTGCEKYWWTNVIYINNIYPWDFYHTCLAWTWYLADDMQFFIISPLIIISFRRFSWLTFGIIGTILAISVIVTGTLVVIFNFKSPIWELMFSSIEYANIIYRMPYSRIPPYLVGMALGFVLYEQKDKTVTIPKIYLLGGWFVAFIVAVTLLCGTITFSLPKSNYNENVIASSLGNSTFIADRHISVLGSLVYEMLSRFAWGLLLSWIVIACQFGGPGWVKDILSWSFWKPLSRMNYNAYLLHVIIVFIFYGNFGMSVYVSRVLMTYYFCGTVLLSYICAMVLTLAVEMPIANIERRFIPGRT